MDEEQRTTRVLRSVEIGSQPCEPGGQRHVFFDDALPNRREPVLGARSSEGQREGQTRAKVNGERERDREEDEAAESNTSWPHRSCQRTIRVDRSYGVR